jgi:hypothetical protein
LSRQDHTQTDTRPHGSQPSSGSHDSAKARKRPPAGDVGKALRSAYQNMVNEDIPPEMLDLLGKLD